MASGASQNHFRIWGKSEEMASGASLRLASYFLHNLLASYSFDNKRSHGAPLMGEKIINQLFLLM